MSEHGRPHPLDKVAELFSAPDVEDLRLSAEGLFVCTKRGWETHARGSLSCSELETLVRILSEYGELQTGLQIPSGDAKLSLPGLEIRAHWILPPLSRLGAEITLRRLPNQKAHYQWVGMQNQESRLKEALSGAKNILVFGATGSGKTSFLNHLLKTYCAHQRIVLLEDYPELSPPNSLSAHLCARPDPYGSRHGVRCDLGLLLIQALRMRPDRIVIGECRGAEARVIYEAMQTGHSGMITSFHAGNFDEARHRFGCLAGAGEVPWDYGIHIQQQTDTGQRRIDVYET
jgi:pilus assembly protein CpaF